MGDGGEVSATQPAAFELNHPANCITNCRAATLTSNHPLVGRCVWGPHGRRPAHAWRQHGLFFAEEALIFRYDHPAGATENEYAHTPGDSSIWADVVNPTHTPRPSRRLATCCSCTGALPAFVWLYDVRRPWFSGLQIDGWRHRTDRGAVDQWKWPLTTAPRGAPAGTWIGELGAGSPEIKVQCSGETTSASITTT